MKFWPLLDSKTDKFPVEGETGCFWENRGDRFHCGVDLFGNENSEVVAIETGVVIGTGFYTNPDQNKCFNLSYFLLIKCSGSLIYKYGGLKEPLAKLGSLIKGGEAIGKLSVVLNIDKVDSDDEFYLREIAYSNNASKLHLEIYKAPFIEVQPYMAGNYLGNQKPSAILDPVQVLRGLYKPVTV